MKSCIKQYISLLLLIIFVTFPYSFAAASSTSTFDFLRLENDARSAALGSALTGSAYGPHAFRHNPGGIAFGKTGSVRFTASQLVEDIKHGDVQFTNQINKNQPYRFGGRLQYLDYGDFIKTELKPSGQTFEPVQTGSFSASATSIEGGVGWKQHYRLSPVQRGYLGVGGVFRYVDSTIADESANAIAIDGGVQWRSTTHPYTLGVSVQNVAITKPKFQKKEEDLPRTITVGGTYQYEPLGLRQHINLVNTRDDTDFQFGTEMFFAGGLRGRIGYDSRSDIGSGLGVGFGFEHNNLLIDYAFVPFGEFGSNNRISVEWRF